MARGITIPQEEFVKHLINGKSQRKAYRLAYPNCNQIDEYVDSKACNLLRSDNVKARYEELIERATSKSIMTAIKRKEWLTKLITDDTSNNSDRLKALDLLNKMDGEYIIKLKGDITLQTVEIEIMEDE